MGNFTHPKKKNEIFSYLHDVPLGSRGPHFVEPGLVLRGLVSRLTWGKPRGRGVTVWGREAVALAANRR